MDRSEKLAEVLGEFARTMLTDFPIQAIQSRDETRVRALRNQRAGAVCVGVGVW